MRVWRVINAVRGVYFHFLGEKIGVFALSLPFNLPCRMERLFKPSITRKGPPEPQRSGEAADLDPPPPPIYQPVISAGGRGRETPPCHTSICCKSLEYFSGDFKGSVRLLRLFFFLFRKRGANRNPRQTTRGSSAGLLSIVNAPVAVVSALRPSQLRH